MTRRRDLLAILLLAALGVARPRRSSAGPQEPAEGGGRPPRANLARFHQVGEGLIREDGVAGATLAVAKDGRLVLARGYGLADVDARRPVTRETLFSLGSVTKSISAVAALKLSEAGKLPLDARLVDILGDIRPPDGGRIADPRFRAITVHHLLYHASGLARDTARPARGDDEEVEEGSTEDIVRVYRQAMTRPLDFAPGGEHRYSNLGFLVLRIAIERASGRPYEAYVRESILAPMGIGRMVLETESYRPDETRRYVLGPKGLRPARHLPHNWLASPTDLMKFMTALLGTRGGPFLAPRTVQRMLAVPPPPVGPNKNGAHVGLGWDSVRKTPDGFRFSKDGAKAGVRAWLEHLPNGVDFALMLNTSPPASAEGPNPFRRAVRLVAEVAESMESWPEVDLFTR